jgi:PAS domain S-box-containing protein
VSHIAGSHGDIRVDVSVPLDSILHTEHLRQRPARPPDYEKENRALVALTRALTDPGANILLLLAEKILEITVCDSSGISLLTKEDGGKHLSWPAIAGAWKPHIGSETPPDYGPGADALDRNCALLFRHFERRYVLFQSMMPPADECLVVPFYVDGTAVGTMWAVMHSDRRGFDAEDCRIMTALGEFAAVAYQILESVAAREESEKVLRRLATGAEQQARSMIDSALDAVVAMNADGMITDWNQQAEETFGWTRSEARGQRMVDTIIPVKYRSLHERGLEQFFKTGQGAVLNRRIEITALRRDGTEFPVELTITPLKSGDTWTFSSFIRDITARKQAEADLRNAHAELAHVNRVMTMGELAASIAHEVNQPLAAIVASGDSCTAWLANEPPNLERARAAASRIVRAATQASDIVRRIRALFKKTTSITTPLEINEVITETVSLVGGELQRKGVSLNTELTANLPAVLGDRIQLQQVILNLTINGTEAMSRFEDQPRRLVIQSKLAEPGEILVSVADTGTGIDPQQTARLFAPFFTTKPEGIGMGLSISRSIIEAHGGRLWAAANQPHGAVFHFVLPAATNA